MRPRPLVAHAVFCAASVAAAGARAGDPAIPSPAPRVVRPARHDLSAPLWLIPPSYAAAAEREMHRPLPLPGRPRRAEPEFLDVTPQAGGPAPDAYGFSMSGPLVSFEGTGNVDGSVPPDPAGDVGPQHFVEWVNGSFAVYDRTGTLLYGPVPGNTLWSGFGGRCELSNSGDPIVLYDALADRWLVSQLAFSWPHDFHQCIAVSQTGDPTGSWHRYDFFFDQDKLNDYPKFGVWPDAYYLAVNQFDAPTQSWRGQGALAFERDVMLAGGPARMIHIDLYGIDPNFGGALPADLDGPIPPPDGAPNYFLEVDDDAWGWGIDRLSLWKFHVDWTNPSASTFGVAGLPDAIIDLTAAGHPFDSDMCGGSVSCIPQPGGARVDALADRLMYRVAYRNFGTHESLVVNHTVDVNGADRAGIRWYEIRDPGGTPVLHQAGTFAPDTDHRFMGSVAMDGAGGIALGYSVSSAATHPSIRYAGRLASDPPGTLAQGEAVLVGGSGYQTEASRWGDYTMLTIDPTDDCTFWYVAEYYGSIGPYPWQTRVGAFEVGGCGQCPLVGRSTLAVDRAPGAVRLTWTAADRAEVHDVIEGGLLALRSSSGDFAAATTGCAADDVVGTSVDLAGPDPAPGDGTWYLVRGVLNGCRGSVDDGGAHLAASRDDGVQAAAATCP